MGNDAFDLVASRATGLIEVLRREERDILISGPQLQIWRGPTDNDGIKGWTDETIMPQEHGNHTDVRWLSLSSENARLVVQAAGPMEFSASHFTAQDLDAAYHTYDLHPRDEVILNLDYRQRGLGTESCGPGPLEQYKIKPGRYEWSYRLRPLGA